VPHGETLHFLAVRQVGFFFASRRTAMTSARTGGREGVSMAEQENATATTEAVESTEPHGAEGSESEKDWKAEYEKVLAQSRKWETRAKSNSEAAKKLAELEDASKTDAERLADATKRAEEAERKVAEYERKAERAGIIAEVAADKGVDQDWLSRMSGDTREEVEGNADWLKTKLSGAPIYPSVSDNGHQGASSITREQIEAIKDPRERVRMRARHIELYNK